MLRDINIAGIYDAVAMWSIDAGFLLIMFSSFNINIIL